MRKQFLPKMVVKQFGELTIRPDRGALIENFSFIHLYRDLSPMKELNFWRTKQGTEVDFILQTENRLVAIEVKYQAMHRTFLPAGIKNFLTAYPATRAAVITKDHFAEINQGKTRILFLPAWLLSTVTS